MMRRDGIIVVDKPAGMTSHDVVARLRRVLGTRKIGHAGTLDPMATGVLVIGVGRGTRLLGYLTRDDKEYDATIRLGQTTSTDDADGEITATFDVSAIGEDLVRRALLEFIGPQHQLPSAVSAVKVGGKRAYELVRAGHTPVLLPRPIVISNVVVQSIVCTPQTIDVEVTVTCSSGTYIRAIARDLGQRLGVGGHLIALRRMRSGVFTHMKVLPTSPEECDLLSLGEVASKSFPTLELTPDEAHLVGNGVKILAQRADANIVYALVDGQHDLVALAERVNDHWSYRVVFVGTS